MIKPNNVSTALTDLRDHAWDYFQLHSNQRIATFNFYIAISTLVATGLVASFHKDINMPFFGIILGLLLIVFSYIFHRLDERNRDLVHYGEEGLKLFEKEIIKQGVAKEITMFHIEEQKTKKKNHKRSPFEQILSPYTYTNCFCAIFWIFGAIGAMGIYVAMWKTILP